MGDGTDDLVERGCDAADRGDLDAAAALFADAVARGARWAALNLGNVRIEQGRWDEAVAAYDVALSAGETSARVNRANVVARSDPAAARREYERAWQEGDPLAAGGLANLDLLAGDHASAVGWLRRALDRGVEGSRWRLAEALSFTGASAEAERLFAASLADGEPGARIAYALYLRRADRAEDAVPELKRALADGETEAWRELAEVYAELGDDVLAEHCFRRAVEHDPSVELATARPRYRWRTRARMALPGVLSRLAPKGRRDCGAHEWYLAEPGVWHCYHCVVGVDHRP